MSFKLNDYLKILRKVQWGLKIQAWKTKHHTKLERFKVQFSNSKKFGFQMVWTMRKRYQNGRYFGHHLKTGHHLNPNTI